MLEVKADGAAAFLYAADGCGWSNTYGCEVDANGAETLCGACVMDDAAIVCAAALE